MYEKKLKVYFNCPKILEFYDKKSFNSAIYFYSKNKIRFEIIRRHI